MSDLKSVSRIDLTPLGGIAGDMFAAALFNAFPDLYQSFLKDIEKLEIAGVTAVLEDRLCNGLQAAYFRVEQQTDIKPPRTLATVKEFLQGTPLEGLLVKHAVGIFTLLAGAEAEVHGKTIDTIHFHEVSDWDSMVDILAAAGIIARLDCSHWRVGALPLGSGTVNTEHGDIPVPAPATVAMLKDFAWHDDGIAGERVTPTGAAILAYLKAQPLDNGAAAARLLATGSGCGTREMEGRANLLRVVAFSGDDLKTGSDEIVRIAFEVDDMTAEEISWATEKLRDHKGVYDVSCLSMHGKKGRVSTGIRVIANPEQTQLILDQCFSVTSTIGVRYENVYRQLLQRSEVQMSDSSAENTNRRVKLASRPDDARTAKTESDDLASATTLAERRLLAAESQSTALDNSSGSEK